MVHIVTTVFQGLTVNISHLNTI